MQNQKVIEGYRLSPQQKYLWLLQERGGALLAQCAISIKGDLDRIALREALQRAINRHEALRTTFHRPPSLDIPLQVIAAHPNPLWVEADIGGTGDEDRGDVVEAFLSDERAHSFDLENGPLLRASLFRRSAREHLLLLSLPALCADSRTLHNLFAEVTTLYGERGPGNLDSDEPVQYVQFSEWQLEILENGAPEEAYWNAYEAHTINSLALPYEAEPGLNSSGSTPGGQKALFVLDVDARLKAAAEAAADKQDATPAAFWFACWQVLLWRLSGNTELAVDYVCDGRVYDELKSAMGPFARSLPVLCRLAEGLEFSETLRQAAESIGRAEQWQQYYVEDGLTADGSRVNAPPVAFEGLSRPASTIVRAAEFAITAEFCQAGLHKIKLSCVTTRDRLKLELQYDAARYSRGLIARYASSLVALAECAARDPQTCIDRLDALGHAERRHLLFALNDTDTDKDDKLPHELFEDNARLTPGRIAVRSGDELLTYDELNRKANALAHYLGQVGVGPEVTVGLYFARSTAMIVALVGVMKAGATYVPLDSTLPKERVAFMLEDAGVSVLLTQERLVDSLPSNKPRTVCLDVDWDLIAPCGQDNSATRGWPENGAYIIYTSGSTGQPKGVVVEQRQLANYIAGNRERLELEPATSYALAQSLTVDFGNTIIFASLCTGGTLHVLAEDLISDADALGDYFTLHGIEFFKIAPSHLSALLATQRPERLMPRKWLLLGGEPSRLELLEEIRRQAPGCKIFNHYGPTETTVGVLTYRADKAATAAGGRQFVPTGRPLPNTRVYLLDRHLKPVPMGVAGELYIAGHGLARGYLARPDLTAERFLPDPFSTTPGSRLYRTGDLARHLEDGSIDYLGRADHQVKVRGYRVELGEIEAVLSGHACVKEAAVTAVEHLPGDKRLVAYISVDKDHQVSPDELRAYLRERLPDYMVPAHVVTLDAMPRTRSGKIDRQALPPPDLTRSEAQGPLIAARTLEEELLTTIWADVLGLDQVYIDDNFFALGGDSIRSIQVLVRARQGGLQVDHNQLFQHQTIRELARAARFDHRVSSEAPASDPFSLISRQDRLRLPDGIEDAYPLARIQAGMIFHSEYSPDSAIYHDIHTYHLKLRFDARVMQAALQDVIGRHPLLRTSFDLTGFTQPLQLVHREVHVPVEAEDLRDLSADEQEKALARYIEDEKARRIDWSRPPLLRITAHLRGDEEIQFTLSYHHAILDGWSSASMQTELFSRYVALMNSPGAQPQEPLAASYRDFVAQEQAALQSEECRRYWQDALGDTAVTRVPRSEGSRPQGNDTRARVLAVPVATEVSEGLKRLSRSMGVPVKNILLAAHLKVLSMLAGQDDVTTGLVSNSRPETQDGDKILGVFLNTIPFRLKVEDGTWSELARKTFEAERELLPFRRYPLAELQRERGGGPLFEAVFNFMHFHVFDAAAGLNAAEVLGYTGYNELNYPLTANFSLAPGSNQIELLIDYHASEISEAQAQAIGGYYLRAMEAIANDPTGRHDQANLLSETELRRLLGDWNSADANWPEQGGIHEMFERQVKETPGATAVICEGERLTYDQLNRRANQLARFLRERGVVREKPVGILMGRSVEMMVAILGILKSGAAYLPLDPGYPQHRLDYLLEDSRAELLVTEQRHLEKLTEYSGKIVCLDRERDELVRERVENLEGGLHAENLAYVIYTSGSTGQPKGVLVSHHNLVMSTLARFSYYSEAVRCFLLLSSYTFDSSIAGIFWTLCRGGALLIPDEDHHQDLIHIVEAIKHNGVTHLLCLPSLYNLILQEADADELAGLSTAIVAGESCPKELVERHYRTLVGTPLFNEYGPTEAAVWSSVHECKEGETRSQIPIGRPIDGARIYILDERKNLAPVGVAGELYIAGHGLARGYLARPDLTAERFLPDPFSTSPGSRLYRTGDLARHLEDGSIDYLGRADHQVKVRGFRIELGEIEAVLSGHECVKAAAVTVIEHPPGDKRIVAYAVLEQGERATAGDLRDFLKGLLPEYMIPSAFVFLERLPLTSNGKLDRRALPAPEQALDEGSRVFIAPQTPAEQVIADLWKQVLRVESVGVRDNFFDLGGHSLLAMQLVVRLRDLFQVELPLRVLYDRPTVEGVVAALSEIRNGRESVEVIAETVQEIALLSEEQVSEMLSDIA